ncbi:MAG: D-alanyl-D-alanine carboxypeptidase family protein [Croceibacterium sp.]
MIITKYLRAAVAASAFWVIGAAPVSPPVEMVTAVPGGAPADPKIPVVLLVDLSSGQTLFSRDPNRRFVPASVTKVMTAYSAFRLISEGKLAPQTPVVVSKELADQWSGEGSTMFLQAGDRLTIGQLLLGVTTVSANDGAVALSMAAVGNEDAWLALMNANAAELGMHDTHFGTPNGWPDEGRTFTSAHDLALLAEALTTRYPELYHRYFGHRGMSYHDIAQDNHDPITGVVPGADGIKTGYTRQSGYNFLGSAKRNGRRLVVVIAAAPSATVRNQTARDMLRWGFDAFSSQVVLPGNVTVGSAEVQNGSSGSVELRTSGDVFASVTNGTPGAVSYAIRYRGPIEAPITKGQQVAMLRVSVAGQEPHDVPLITDRAVARANLLQRLWNGVVGLLT